jgi:hypothetical protein
LNEKLEQTRFSEPGFVLFKDDEFLFHRQFWERVNSIIGYFLSINLPRFFFVLTFFTDLALSLPNQVREALIKECNEHLQYIFVGRLISDRHCS